MRVWIRVTLTILMLYAVCSNPNAQANRGESTESSISIGASEFVSSVPEDFRRYFVLADGGRKVLFQPGESKCSKALKWLEETYTGNVAVISRLVKCNLESCLAATRGGRTFCGRNALGHTRYFRNKCHQCAAGCKDVQGGGTRYISRRQDDCRIAEQECKALSCASNSACVYTETGYLCHCPAGFQGNICDVNVDECASSPCQNGATCLDNINRYECNCATGFQGANCNIDVDECASSPCQNGAICLDNINGYECNCATGFQGTNCVEDIDECASSPCQNGATCRDMVNGYTCNCVPGFEGSNCETSSEPELRVSLQRSHTNPGLGDKVTVRCDASDVSAPIRWYKDGLQLETGLYDDLFVLSSAILILEFDYIHQGEYSCRASREEDGAIAEVDFTFRLPLELQFATYPRNIKIRQYSDGVLHCSPVNRLHIVRWEKDGAPLSMNEHVFQVFDDILITDAREREAGLYTCVLYSGSQRIREVSAYVIVDTLPNINRESRLSAEALFSTYPENTTIPQFDDHVLPCSPVNSSHVVIWEIDGEPLELNEHLSMELGDNILFRNATLHQTGIYTCVLYSGYQRIQEVSAHVTVVARQEKDESESAVKDLDGGWSDYGEWSECSQTCEEGIQTRTRTCTNPRPQYGGRVCEGIDTETQICRNRRVCPVHGGWSDWGRWSPCDSPRCGVDGTRFRSRECANPKPKNRGNYCVGPIIDRETCSKCAVIHGGWSEWGDWGRQCSVSCGEGTQTRHRRCNNPTPENGGDDCVGENSEFAICDEGPCPIIHGGWSEWGDWGRQCSVSCGEGTQTRHRRCNNPTPKNGGDDCVGENSEVAICDEGPCPICGTISAEEAVGTDGSAGTGRSFRIVGGRKAVHGSSPWIARLYDISSRAHFCAGSIVSNLWIISTAYCILESGITVNTLMIRLGDYDTRVTDDSEILLGVAEIIIPDGYNANTFDQDIALIRLSAPLNFTDYLRPICLPNITLARKLYKAGIEGKVVGWGRLSESGPLPRYLTEVNLPLVGKRRCRASTNYTVTTNMFCAGYPRESRDTCTGDSGGPFAVDFQGRWYLLGITSWGEGCAQEGKYGFYTRVSKLLDWTNSYIHS